jgi:hypothetical protein
MHVLMLLQERGCDDPTVSLYADTPEGMERAMLIVANTIKGWDSPAYPRPSCIGAWYHASDDHWLTLTREVVMG